MAVPSTALSMGELHAILSPIPQPFNLYGRAYRSGGLAESHLIPLPGGEGSFPCYVLPCDMVNCESVVGIKPGDGDSRVMAGCQVEFSQT